MRIHNFFPIWNRTGEGRVGIIKKIPAYLTVAGEWNRTGENRAAYPVRAVRSLLPRVNKMRGTPPMPRLTQLDRFWQMGPIRRCYGEANHLKGCAWNI